MWRTPVTCLTLSTGKPYGSQLHKKRASDFYPDLAVAFDRCLTGKWPVFVFCGVAPLHSRLRCVAVRPNISIARRERNRCSVTRGWLDGDDARWAAGEKWKPTGGPKRRTDRRTNEQKQQLQLRRTAAARRLIERAFSHICSSSLITLPLQGFSSAAATTVGSWRQTYWVAERDALPLMYQLVTARRPPCLVHRNDSALAGWMTTAQMLLHVSWRLPNFHFNQCDTTDIANVASCQQGKHRSNSNTRHWLHFDFATLSLYLYN